MQKKRKVNFQLKRSRFAKFLAPLGNHISAAGSTSSPTDTILTTVKHDSNYTIKSDERINVKFAGAPGFLPTNAR